MQCPCHECQSRKPTSHDRCEEYMEYHDALVAAKEATRAATSALEYLIRMAEKREKKARVRR